MDNGFDRCCPSGNIMVDSWHEPRTVECGKCNGSGTLPWTNIEEYVDHLSTVIWKMKKTGREPKTFVALMKLARVIKQEGQECPLCDGTGRIEV